MRSVYTGWPNSENNRAWEDLIRRQSLSLMHMFNRLHLN
jgi:hypothetical protein